MNFYRIEIGYDSKESIDGIPFYETTFLSHKDSMTSNEFREICNKAKVDCIRKYGEVCLYNMVSILKESYGFKSLEVTASWEY